MIFRKFYTFCCGTSRLMASQTVLTSCFDRMLISHILRTPFLRLLIVSILLYPYHSTFARFDPTQPPGYTAPSKVTTQTVRQSNLIISAIIISPNRRLAIVNDKVVREGEEIFGAKVISITSTEVKFRGPEGDFSIPFIESTKKPIIKGAS